MLEMRAAHFQHNNFPPWGGRAARGMLGGVRNRLVAAVPHFNFPSPGRAEPRERCLVIVSNRLVAAVPHFNFPSPGRAEPHERCLVKVRSRLVAAVPHFNFPPSGAAEPREGPAAGPSRGSAAPEGGKLKCGTAATSLLRTLTKHRSCGSALPGDGKLKCGTAATSLFETITKHRSRGSAAPEGGKLKCGTAATSLFHTPPNIPRAALPPQGGS